MYFCTLIVLERKRGIRSQRSEIKHIIEFTIQTSTNRFWKVCINQENRVEIKRCSLYVIQLLFLLHSELKFIFISNFNNKPGPSHFISIQFSSCANEIAPSMAYGFCRQTVIGMEVLKKKLLCFLPGRRGVFKRRSTDLLILTDDCTQIDWTFYFYLLKFVRLSRVNIALC